MLHISQVFYKKEQSDAAKEGRPIKDFGEFAKHLNQHIYNNSIFAGKVHDNIVKILLKTQLVVEQKYAIIGGGDGAKDSKGVISKSDQGRKEQQVAGMRDHTELPTHPEHSEKSSQSKDELDVKLHEIIRANPEITQKIEENGGYDSKNQQYFGFTNKGPSNSGSIFEVISASTQGKYSAGLLQSIACPASTSSGTPLFPPPTLPKSPSASASGGQPIYSFNTVGSGEIVLPLELLGKPVPSITVPKDVVPSNKPTTDPSEFKWTVEGVAHLLAASKSKDNQPFDHSMLFLNKDEQKGKNLATYSKLTTEEKAQIIAVSGGHFDPNAIDHIEAIYNKCLEEIESRKNQPVKSVEDRIDQAVKYTNKILEDTGKDPYKMQMAEYRVGGEITGLILRSITDNIRKATDQLPKTKAILTTPFACAGEIAGYGVTPIVNYIDPEGKIRQAIRDIPDEGTKTLLGITGGTALGVGMGLAAKGVVDTAKKVVLKAVGIEAVGGVGSALTAEATTLGKGAVGGEIAGIGENAIKPSSVLKAEVGELGASNVASDLSLQKHTSLKQYENWSQLPELVKKVPEEFGTAIHATKGVGLKWKMQDKAGKHDIRIDQGNPATDYPTQRVDHVAISYSSKVVDNTGKNYILKDDATGAVYKIERSKFDAGKRGIEHGFDIRTDIKGPTKHPDAHIKADEWAKWKNFHEPD